MKNLNHKQLKKIIFVILGIMIFICCFFIAMISPSDEQSIPTELQVPTVTKITKSNDRCIPASNLQLEAILLGVKGISEQNYIETGWSVKSKGYKNAWFVAAKIYGPGIENGIGPGLWIISGDPENPSSGAFSVNEIAKVFSDRGTGETLGLSFSIYDDGAQESLNCLIDQ